MCLAAEVQVEKKWPEHRCDFAKQKVFLDAKYKVNQSQSRVQVSNALLLATAPSFVHDRHGHSWTVSVFGQNLIRVLTFLWLLPGCGISCLSSSLEYLKLKTIIDWSIWI